MGFSKKINELELCYGLETDSSDSKKQNAHTAAVKELVPYSLPYSLPLSVVLFSTQPGYHGTIVGHGIFSKNYAHHPLRTALSQRCEGQ